MKGAIGHSTKNKDERGTKYILCIIERLTLILHVYNIQNSEIIQDYHINMEKVEILKKCKLTRTPYSPPHELCS